MNNEARQANSLRLWNSVSKKNANLEEIEAILNSVDGVDVNFKKSLGQSKTQYTILKIAVFRKNRDVVRLLLKQPGLEIDSFDPNDERDITALMHAVNLGEVEIIDDLIRSGAQVNIVAAGRTALFVATTNLHVVDDSLQKLTMDTRDGVTHLVSQLNAYPTSQVGFKIVNMLLREGADVNFQGGRNDNTPLMNSLKAKDSAVVSLILLRNPDLSLREIQQGATALIFAAAVGNAKNVGLVADKSKNLEEVDYDGHTALVVAAGKKHRSAVETLLRRGAKLDVANKRGETLQDLIEMEGYEKIKEVVRRHQSSQQSEIVTKPAAVEVLTLEKVVRKRNAGLTKEALQKSDLTAPEILDVVPVAIEVINKDALTRIFSDSRVVAEFVSKDNKAIKTCCDEWRNMAKSKIKSSDKCDQVKKEIGNFETAVLQAIKQPAKDQHQKAEPKQVVAAKENSETDLLDKKVFEEVVKKSAKQIVAEVKSELLLESIQEVMAEELFRKAEKEKKRADKKSTTEAVENFAQEILAEVVLEVAQEVDREAKAKIATERGEIEYDKEWLLENSSKQQELEKNFEWSITEKEDFLTRLQELEGQPNTIVVTPNATRSARESNGRTINK